MRAIIAYLALNGDRPLTLEEIQNAVWPLSENRRDIKRSAMRNYMVDARKAVERGASAKRLGKPGYQLVDVDTDWAEFQRLVAQARSAGKARALELRREALALVRGLPFAADTSRYFAWAFSASFLYKVIESVTECAHDVSTSLVLAGDLPGAEVDNSSRPADRSCVPQTLGGSHRRAAGDCRTQFAGSALARRWFGVAG